MSENSVLRFTVSFLLINSRSSFFLQSHISVKTEPLELLYVPPFFYIDQLMLILDSGYQDRGAHLKNLRRAEGGAKYFGLFRVKNHDFTPKNLIFSNFFWGGGGGAGCTPSGSAPKTCTYLKCNLLIIVLMINNDIFFV